MQALADAVGATKSQIQFWTGKGILGYLPGTGGGQGKQRLYPRTEQPFAAMARYLAASGVRVDTIRLAVFGARDSLNPRPGQKGAKPLWCRRALRGEVESYMVISHHPKDGGYASGFSWENPDDLIKMLPRRHGSTIINVQKVLSPYAE